MAVDWFERLTGLSPDGGNGMYEVAIYAAVVGAIVLVAWLWKRTKNGR